MLSRKYAEWIMTPELAATILNGQLRGSDIWNDVCSFAGGWCNDARVFLAWDAMGRPDESEYMHPEYPSERDPERRRAIVANARISAMAQLVADTLIDIAKEALARDGHPASEAEAETGRGKNDCTTPGFAGEGHLIKPEGK